VSDHISGSAIQMSRQRRDLKLVYEPDEGWAHFVLYTEPTRGAVASAFNATVAVERETPYSREWLGRLERCEPNTLHTTLVSSDKIPNLFHPCVYEDKDSPGAIAGSGCVCLQPWYDPEFGLPVVADHYRTVGGAIERWKYKEGGGGTYGRGHSSTESHRTIAGVLHAV